MNLEMFFQRLRNCRQNTLTGLAVAALGAGLFSPAFADTHLLPVNQWESESWTVQARIEGQDVKFCQEGEEGALGLGNRVILYTAPKEASVSVWAEFRGELPPDVQPIGQTIEMFGQQDTHWTTEGGVATTTVSLITNQEHLVEYCLLQGRAVLHTTDTNWTPTANFTATLYVARPISVAAGGAVGGSLALYAYAQTPYVRSNTLTGVSWVDYLSEPLPDAQVKAEAVEGVEVASGWLTTGEAGNARATVWAETSSLVDVAGLVSGRVRIKAVKDRATVQREVDLHIPYANVASANGAFLVGRAGAILEPRGIIDGEILRPGDVVRVGNEFIGTGPYLNVSFCNGQRVTLQSDTVGGIRAVVGQGSFDHRTPVLKASLENAVQNIQADPRRYGRMLVYKALGNAVDGLLGIPNAVGWSVTTPGGAVEEWVGDFAESAYQPGGNPVRKDGPVFGPGDSSAPDAPWAASVVDFYSDGTARAYNRGATLRVSGPSASATASLGGMVVARLNVPGGTTSPTGSAPLGGFAPFISIAPTNGAADVAIRPTLRLQFTEFGFNSVLPGSLRCRLDGRLLESQIRFDSGEFVHQVPATAALAPGSHQWDVEFALLHGGLAHTSVAFSVTSALPAPRGVRAAAGQQRVGLCWDAEALAWAHGGFRVYRTAGGGSPVLISGETPLRQPNFVDASPVASASYAVAGLDTGGNEGPHSAPVAVTFPGSAPAAPLAPVIAAESPEPGPGLALVIEDSTPGFTLWRIEAASSAIGPFADVLVGELTSMDHWPIPEPFAETRPFYRVTAVNVDGAAGAPVVVGPLAVPVPLPAVAGLTAALNTNGTVTLQWDAWSARPKLGYRIERWSTGQWSLAADVDAATLSWTDTPAANGALFQWRVAARLTAGGTSPVSPAMGLRWQPASVQPGSIRFAGGTQSGFEGVTLPVQIIREGGSDGPAFVTWSSWGWAGNASPEVDYTPGAGLLIFAPGETEKIVNIPLLADNMRERPDESFYVYLRGVEGGPALTEPSMAQVFITDGPELAWESIWLYTTEDGPPEMRFRVTLSTPVGYPVSVDYEFQAAMSTATHGADFTGPVSGTLTFAPGETNQSFAVTVVNDALKEGTQSETVKYRLLNPQGASIDGTDPFRWYATLEIRDDDTQAGYAVFAGNSVRLREGESRPVTLRREGGSDGALDVFLFGMGGSAQQGDDWALDPPSPSFADGQTNLTVSLTAAADGVAEGAEVLILGAFAGMGGPGQMATMLVVIQDADAPVSGFDTWAAEQLAAFPAEKRPPHADADADGIPNWAEFLWRTNPAQSDRPALPQHSFSEWGEWQLAVTVTDDPALVVVAEFSNDVAWNTVTFDAGTWQANPDGTRTGVFRMFNFGGTAGFVRFRAEWIGAE